MDDNIDMVNENEVIPVNTKGRPIIVIFLLEFIGIGLIVFVGIVFLNYFDIIPLSASPMFSFLPRKTVVKNNPQTKVEINKNNNPTITIPSKLSLDPNRNPNVKSNISVIEFETNVLDISTAGGVTDTPQGKRQYEEMLSIQNGATTNIYYYEKDDLEKIKVYVDVNGKEEIAKFGDLKKGDKIKMYYTSDFITKKMIELKIVRIK